jgi:hypothetical protein
LGNELLKGLRPGEGLLGNPAEERAFTGRQKKQQQQQKVSLSYAFILLWITVTLSLAAKQQRQPDEDDDVGMLDDSKVEVRPEDTEPERSDSKMDTVHSGDYKSKSQLELYAKSGLQVGV